MSNPKILSVLLLLMLASWCRGYSQANPVSVNIVSPRSVSIPPIPPIVGDVLSITAAAYSPYQIDSVIATVDGRSVLLTYNASAYDYEGTLSLLGLPQDTLTLTVRAVDANNNSSATTSQFIYDHPPTMTVDSPAAYTVAMPYLHVRGHCHSDSGACTINVSLIGAGSPTLGTFTDSCDVSYDLSAYEGAATSAASLSLNVQGTDNRGVTTNLSWIPVFVETSPYLTPVFTADNKIYDFSGNKVLVMQQGTISHPHIQNISDGSVTTIPFTGNVPTPIGGHLSSHGAIFNGLSLSSTGAGGFASQQNLFEWHDGSLDSSFSAPTVPYTAAGDYAVFCDLSNNIVVRNLATQVNQVVGPRTSVTIQSVTASGIAEYSTAPSYGETVLNLYNYTTGGSTVVVDDKTGKALGGAYTDGTHTVYEQATSPGPSIVFAQGVTYTEVLSVLGAGGTATDGTVYQLNNGFTAYLNPNTTGVRQVWLRDTAGTKRQIGSGGATSLDFLNPKGQLLYFSDTTITNGRTVQYAYYRYMYLPSAGYFPIGGYQGQGFYQDSTWYVVIGRTLFQLNPSPAPNRSDNFSVNVKPDSSVGFSPGSFSAHFEGNGTLMSVLLTRVPAHGTLTVNGAQLSANVSVSRAALQNLVYTPTAGFEGIDTVYWVGSTGFTSSVDTGKLLLNVNVVVMPPAQPAISGLAAVYCTNGGPAVFTMTNFPDTSAGTVVTDTLDNGQLAIGANASCSIALSWLSAGVHTVKVTYSNAGGNSSVTQAFTVVAASTPVVAISASTTTILNTAASVVVWANNASGGGSAPKYTFALNPGFAPALYGPGADDTVVIDTAALAIGVNKVYVRMQTSDSCFTAQIATDSIVITRSASAGGGGNPGGGNPAGGSQDSTGNTANDSTSSSLTVGPNPFHDQLVIKGLQSSVPYTISLLNGNGVEVIRTRVAGVTQTTFITGPVTTGIYILRLYDETKGKVLRYVKLLAMGSN
jgi:hypothetical protein